MIHTESPPSDFILFYFEIRNPSIHIVLINHVNWDFLFELLEITGF